MKKDRRSKIVELSLENIGRVGLSKAKRAALVGVGAPICNRHYSEVRLDDGTSTLTIRDYDSIADALNLLPSPTRKKRKKKEDIEEVANLNAAPAGPNLMEVDAEVPLQAEDGAAIVIQFSNVMRYCNMPSVAAPS